MKTPRTVQLLADAASRTYKPVIVNWTTDAPDPDTRWRSSAAGLPASTRRTSPRTPSRISSKASTSRRSATGRLAREANTSTPSLKSRARSLPTRALRSFTFSTTSRPDSCSQPSGSVRLPQALPQRRKRPLRPRAASAFRSRSRSRPKGSRTRPTWEACFSTS